jgi:D-glycero-D-manno-heptose 1,7-bisphosphate phosphatase
MVLRKAVFLDRDGVINRPIVRDGRPYPPRDLSEFAWMDGVHETLRSLHARGFMLLVFTNQPDVARGTQTREQVEELHSLVLRELPVTRIYSCFHDDGDDCACRKPKPGMIFQARDEYGIDLHGSWVVGDRWRDIEAGRAAGCRTVYVRHGYTETPAEGYDHVVTGLNELLDWIT